MNVVTGLYSSVIAILRSFWDIFVLSADAVFNPQTVTEGGVKITSQATCLYAIHSTIPTDMLW